MTKSTDVHISRQWLSVHHFLFPPLAGYCPQTKHPSDLFHPHSFFLFFSSRSDFYMSSLDPALPPRNRPKTGIHELCIAVCVRARQCGAQETWCSFTVCNHPRMFFVVSDYFSGRDFFSLSLSLSERFHVLLQAMMWLNFEEHSASHFCVLQNITPVLRSTFTVHNGGNKKAFNTLTDVLLQPRVRVLVRFFLQLLAGSFVLNQPDKQRSDSSTLFQVDHFEEAHSCQNTAAATTWPSAPPLPVETSVVSYSRGAVSLSSEGHVGSHRWEMVMEGLGCNKKLLFVSCINLLNCQMTWLSVFVASFRQHQPQDGNSSEAFCLVLLMCSVSADPWKYGLSIFLFFALCDVGQACCCNSGGEPCVDLWCVFVTALIQNSTWGHGQSFEGHHRRSVNDHKRNMFRREHLMPNRYCYNSWRINLQDTWGI